MQFQIGRPETVGRIFHVILPTDKQNTKWIS